MPAGPFLQYLVNSDPARLYDSPHKFSCSPHTLAVCGYPSHTLRRRILCELPIVFAAEVCVCALRLCRGTSFLPLHARGPLYRRGYISVGCSWATGILSNYAKSMSPRPYFTMTFASVHSSMKKDSPMRTWLINSTFSPSRVSWRLIVTSGTPLWQLTPPSMASSTVTQCTSITLSSGEGCPGLPRDHSSRCIDEWEMAK